MSHIKFGTLGELDSLLTGSTLSYIAKIMNKLKRPRVDFERTDTDVRVTLYFKKTSRAVKFMSKLFTKPPKGVIKL